MLVDLKHAVHLPVRQDEIASNPMGLIGRSKVDKTLPKSYNADTSANCSPSSTTTRRRGTEATGSNLSARCC